MAAGPPYTIRRRPNHRARCETCTSRDARLHYRLDRNLNPTYRRLCGTCARKTAFTPVDWRRNLYGPGTGPPIHGGGT